MELALDDHRVDHCPDIINGGVIDEADRAGFRIDLDLGYVGAARISEVDRIVISLLLKARFKHFKRIIVRYVGGECNFRKSLLAIGSGDFEFARLELVLVKGVWSSADTRFPIIASVGRRYYEETGSAASAETIRSAVDLLEARAQFGAPERTVHIRVAEHDGRTYLDFADKEWRAVQIGPDGWQVVTFSTGSVPSCRRHAAASCSAEGRIDRSPRSFPQSFSAR